MSSIPLPYFGQDDEQIGSLDRQMGGADPNSISIPQYGASSQPGPLQPNALIKLARRMQAMKQAGGGQQPGSGQQPWSPVQTYSNIGNVAGTLAGMAFGANGLNVQGPTNAMLGEAGAEDLIHPDGSREFIGHPQVRTLGMSGPERVIPLTPGPHKPTSEGKALMKRLNVKHRFADGGMVYGPDNPFIPQGPPSPFIPPGNYGQLPVTPQDVGQAPYAPMAGMDQPPQLVSPEVQQVSPSDAANQNAMGSMANAPIPPSARDRLAALKTPVAKTPNIWQRIGAAAIGGAAGYVNASGKRMAQIDPTAAQNTIKYPGYGEQVQQYNAQRADLTNQIQQQQGTTADAMANQNLALGAQRLQIGQQELANYPQSQQLAHPELIPDPDPNRQDPTTYPGLHVVVGNQRLYRPTPEESAKNEAAAKAAGTKEEYEPLGDVLTESLGLPRGMKVPPASFEKYAALHMKGLEAKNPSLPSLALQAAHGDPAKALQLIAQTNQASKISISNGDKEDRANVRDAIRQAYWQYGDWGKVLEAAQAQKFGQYSPDVAEHAQKMNQLPSPQQAKVAAAGTTQEQVQTAIDAIQQFTKAHPDLVGSGWANPATGVKRWVETKAGTEPSDIGNVDMALSSVAALQPQQHGFRSAQAMEEFKKNLGIDLRTHNYDPNRAWLVNPGKAISALQSVADFNGKLKDNILKTAGKGGSGGTPAASVLPPQAASKLQEGVVTTFANGQRWTKRGGQAVQVQ